MWPVMTLTLLLQLTDDEQLYAQETNTKEIMIEAPASTPEENKSSQASWPRQEEKDQQESIG